MNLINDLIRGSVILSVLALTQHSCSVKQMAHKASEAHKKGLSSYGGYSRELVGQQGSWVRE